MAKRNKPVKNSDFVVENESDSDGGIEMTSSYIESDIAGDNNAPNSLSERYFRYHGNTLICATNYKVFESGKCYKESDLKGSTIILDQMLSTDIFKNRKEVGNITGIVADYSGKPFQVSKKEYDIATPMVDAKGNTIYIKSKFCGIPKDQMKMAVEVTEQDYIQSRLMSVNEYSQDSSRFNKYKM